MSEREDDTVTRAAAALRGGVRSTPAARARIMEAVSAEPRPVRGSGPVADLASARRPLWRSPAIGLLAAASIAGIVALVHARGVDGPIPKVPGYPALHGTSTAAASRKDSLHAAAVSAATAGSIPRPGEIAVARVQFVLVAPKAQRVTVVGDFNDWDPAATPLRVAGGVWSREVEIPVGRHDYAFVVDGAQWVADPSAPRAPADEFGKGYSVLVVEGDR